MYAFPKRIHHLARPEKCRVPNRYSKDLRSPMSSPRTLPTLIFSLLVPRYAFCMLDAQFANSPISQLLAQPPRRVYKPEGWTFKGKRFWKLNFQAVIKSAASAIPPKNKSREPRPRAPGHGSAGGRRPRGAPLGLGSLDLVFGEAALTADLITAWSEDLNTLFVIAQGIWAAEPAQKYASQQFMQLPTLTIRSLKTAFKMVKRSPFEA